MAIGLVRHLSALIARLALDGGANATHQSWNDCRGQAAGGPCWVLFQCSCRCVVNRRSGCFNALFGFDRSVSTLRMSDDC
jgi:hypothetical protein